MPKQACCCNPVGRHIAVACRYYGRSVVYSLNGDVGVTAGSAGSSGASGSTGGSTTNLITGIDYGYGGPDGFSTVTGGIQKFFGWTSYGESFGNEPIFGSDMSGYAHRGPVKWVAEIKQFDTTRDVILLSRSGGGSSQYEWDEAEPKGGHSALLQTRVKASLALEGFAGIGGNNYIGGLPSIMGEQLDGNDDPTIVGGGAGGGGGKDARGGYGGITYGYRGDGSFGGYGGGQNAAGLAGGPSAFNGGTLYGGSGANDGGGGGGGRYAGGGGDEGSGGGGGASKWPSNQSGSSFDDINYSEDASDRGPGGVCDPFINYYPLDTTVFGWHAGMGGGANVVFDLEADQNLNSSTRFLGFGYDYNPFKQGIPGVITAIWVDKYCPCSEISGGETGGQGIELGAQEEETEQTSNSSTELPSKMYICLTDEQYQVLENFKDPENQDLDVPHPRFTLDGEVYVYVGVCVNSYCPSIRLVEGTPTNLAKTDLGGGGAASFNGTYNDCCDVMICGRYCKLPQADCYSCRCFESCITDLSKPKYCCENLDEKPDEYWSISEGWLWRCKKRKKFWYPFGLTPKDTLPPNNELMFDGMAVNGPFEKGCLPVTSSGLTGTALEEFINSNCFPENPNLDCTNYLGWNSEPCNKTLPPKDWEGKLVWPIAVSADLCVDLKDYQQYAFSTSLPVDCTCIPTDVVSCVNVGCNKESKNHSFSFSECDLIPAFGGSYVGNKYSGCTNIFSPDGKIQCQVEQAGNVFNTRDSFICREVLGLTVRIPRCHPDPENPQITDPLKNNGIDGIGPGTFTPGTLGPGWIYTCEKRVTGYGTLGEFVSALQDGLQLDVDITVNEPRLWLSVRPYTVPCTGTQTTLPPDLLFRIQITETLDYMLLEYYFVPVGYYFMIDARVFSRDPTNFPKYLGDEPVCNPACECQTGKTYEVDYERSDASRYAYFTEPYYLFENSGGETPTLVRGEYQTSPEFGSGPDVGLAVMPDQIKEQICPVNPDAIGSAGLAIRSKASCMTVTIGDFPFCQTTTSIETNICYPDFLEITYG